MNRIWSAATAAAALLASAALTAPAGAAISIDTTSAPHGEFGCFGTNSSMCGANFGQSFTTAIGANALSSLTFYMNMEQGASLAVQLKVFAWNGSDTTGSALYTSGVRTISGTTATAMDFTPNVTLGVGQQYIAFLTSVGLGNTNAQYAGMQVAQGDAYSGGSFYFQFSDANHNWINVYQDTAFKMTLDAGVAAVPEPSSWALMIVGFGLVGGVLRRRRTVAAPRFDLAAGLPAPGTGPEMPRDVGRG